MAVLVTGASSGLGAAFARAYAARGDDLVLTARRTDRLEALATELRSAHGRTVHVVSVDLGAPDGPDALIADIGRAGIGIDTLVNNAGYGGSGAFADLDRDSQLGQIDLNCRALVALCHAVLPEMRAAGRGGILNIASTAAFQPAPWLAVYSATKAFVLSFTEALHEELRGTGIHVAALCPGPTRTEFAERAGMGNSPLFRHATGDVAGVVADGIAALDRNEAVRVSGMANAAMAASVGFLPRRWVRQLAGALQKTRG